MGLLNNWLRKKKQEQLGKTGEKKSASVAAVKSDSAKAAPNKSEKTAAENKAKQKVKLSAQSIAFKILIKPIVTEKSAIAESKNKYSFAVAKSADKNQIKTAIKEIYGVEPSRINVINMEGRQVRFGRTVGRRGDYKKAIITLPHGKTIDIHVGV